ncbi:MAG: hypothetical protein R6U37_07690 [Dehalococcoidia bacterium]
MSGYDPYIDRTKDYITYLEQQGRQIKEFECSGSIEEIRKDMPVEFRAGANPNIIMKSKTFAELGNPQAGSSSFILWTENSSALQDGKITLIGPDIPESPGASLTFGQVLIMGGEDLYPDLQETMEDCEHLGDQLEGYMERTTTDSIWGRISTDAAAKGFSMETIGKALMISMKSAIEEIESMEILFVTSAKEDIMPLKEIAKDTLSIRDDLIREFWKSKGYELTCNLDCSACEFRDGCNGIKQMLLEKWKMEQR